MVKCKYETSNGRCGLKDCYAYRHKCYTEEFCKCHQPQTNADHIRAMNDEELAKFLECFGLCHYCTEHYRLGELRIYADEKCDEKCVEHCLEWLEQPAE